MYLKKEAKQLIEMHYYNIMKNTWLKRLYI
jgi:hypothetical protein